MKLVCALLCLAIIAPSAEAIDNTIQVTLESAPGGTTSSSTYTDVPDSTYLFNLHNPPFDLTYNGHGNYSPGSLWTADIQTSIQATITDSVSYTVSVQFNGTHTFAATASYNHQSLLYFFHYWNSYYSETLDGVEICSGGTERHTFAPTPPQVYFQFNQRGDKTSAGTTPPNLWVGIHDNFMGERLVGYRTTQGTCALGATAPDVADSMGAFLPVNEMTGAPLVSITSSDGTPKTHILTYQFATQANTFSAINASATPSGCLGPSILGLCIFGFLGTFFGTILIVAASPIALVISLLPGGQSILGFAGEAWGAIQEIFVVFGSFLLMSGPGFPPGGVLYMVFMWMLSLGFLVWGYSGNPGHILMLPWLFLKYYFILVFLLTVGLFVLLPLKVFQLIAEAIP